MLKERLEEFVVFLRENEKSAATVEKYARDATAFADFIGNRDVNRELVIGYKQYIIEKGYAARSVNSMIASVNEASIKVPVSWAIIFHLREVVCPWKCRRI